ncbi:recombinase family protein [Virgibacillus sp. W0430]|uniref:recombinase family protein n=1 Tax=Virgibacillus sp. W0430 TaxID=3391580 RepID=UPI003F44D967
MTKKAAIYARVATVEQAKGFNIEIQVEHLRSYLNNKGYKKIEVFVDDGYTGNSLSRPGFKRLMSELGEFEAIAVTNIDRISRNYDEVILLINNNLEPLNKKLLVSTCDVDSSTPTGYIFLSLINTFRKYEWTQRNESIRHGLKRRASLGKWNGRVMLGYDLLNGRLTINEKESMIVKEIFELRSDMNTYKSIAEYLNNKGYKTKQGNSFVSNSIRTILKNPIYAGLIRDNLSDEKLYSNSNANIQFVEGNHAPIINQDLWERVQKKTIDTKSDFISA